MTIQVTGTLTSPTGEALIATNIRIVTVSSEYSIKGAESLITTSGSGDYAFNLVEGVFSIEIKQAKEYTKETLIEITSDMSGEYTLAKLLNEHVYTAI